MVTFTKLPAATLAGWLIVEAIAPAHDKAPDAISQLAPNDHVHEWQQRNTPPGQVRVEMVQGTSTTFAAPTFITTTPQQYIDTPQPFISRPSA